MCVERRLVATCSPQNLQRALPGEMWTRCIPNSLSGSLFARQGQAGAQAPVVGKWLLRRASRSKSLRRLSRPIRLPIPVTRQDVLNLVSRGSSPHVLAVTTVEMTVRSAHSWYASLVWLKGNVFPTVAFMLICPVSISLTWRGESRRSLVPPPVPGQ